MARKSNKTSHVLNLLAGEESVPEAEEKKEEKEKNNTEAKAESEESADQKAPAPDSPEISIVTAGNSTDDPLSDLIRDQLEETLEQAENQETAAEESIPEASHDEKSKEAVTENMESDQNTSSPQTMDTGELSSLKTESSADNTMNTDTTADTDNSVAADTNAEADTAIDTNAVAKKDSATDSNATAKDDSALASDITEEKDSALPSNITEEEDSASASNTTEEDDSAIDTNISPEELSAAPDTITDANVDAAASEALLPNHPVISPDHLNALLYPEDVEDDSVHYRFINVMEYVVKDMVLDYMQKFGMCTCERCVVDTTALTLTFCSAKYIVVDKHTVSPLLNYYASKYTGDVTVALTRACTMVNENPRH